MRMQSLRRLAAGTFLSGAAVLSLTGTALASNTPTVNRLAGTDRYDTSRVIASADYGTTGAHIAIIASGVNYPDALAAGYLAGRDHAPILLTDPNNLSAATLQALQYVKATGAVVVGGTAAVSDNVVNQLKAKGYQTSRVFGSNRYGTAQAIDTLFPASFVGSFGSAGPTAVVATGLNFADALSASPLPYQAAFPMVLTDPSTLSPEAQSTLSSLGIKNVIIMGGTAAVSANVASQIAGMGITETRIAGADRTQTATMLADQIEIGQLAYTNARSVLARGDNFADALSGGPHAALFKAPIVLTEDPNTLGQYTTAWYQSHNTTMANIDVLGGTAAVSNATATAAQTAASS